MSDQALSIWRPIPKQRRAALPSTDRFQLEPLERRYHLSAQVDPAFGQRGHAYVSGPAGSTQWGASLAVQSNGAIVLAGYAPSLSGAARGTSVLRRLSPDGATDPTFHPADIPDSWFHRLLLQDDDRFILMMDDKLIRMNPDGQVDSTFDYRLPAPLSAEGNNFEFYDVALCPDGSILAILSFDTSAGRMDALARFNADGTPDTSFGHDGVVDGIGLLAVRPTPDGHILFVSGDDLRRLNPDGSVDSTFGQEGHAHIPAQPWPDNPYLDPQNPLVVQADGTILIGVTTVQPLPDGWTLWLDYLARFTPDGRLDTTFGGAGLLALPPEAESMDMLRRDDGRIDVVLTFDDEPGMPSGALGVFRLNADYTPDTTFGPGGIVRIDGSSISDAVIAQQGDNVIVLENDTDIDPGPVDAARFFHVVRLVEAPASSSGNERYLANPRATANASSAFARIPIFDDVRDQLDWHATDQLWA